jgi:hypothetical protein
VYCSTCGDERDFEQPPCPDGHGSDCPERACTACGTAVLAGFPLTAAVPAHRVAITIAGGPEGTPPQNDADISGPTRAASQRAVA